MGDDLLEKRFSVKSDFFIALCTAELFFAFLELPGPHEFSLSCFIGFGSFLYYRFLHGYNTESARYQLPILWYIGLLFSLVWFYFLDQTFDLIKWQYILAFVILLIYQTPIGSFKLRNIPYLKSVIISIIWTYLLVWFPISLKSIPFTTAVYCVVENFFFILALTLVYDSYDAEIDESFGLVTLVNFKLKKYANLIIIGLLIVATFPMLFHWVLGGNEIKILHKYSFYAQIITTILILPLLVFKVKIPKSYLFIWDGFILVKAMIIIFLMNLIVI